MNPNTPNNTIEPLQSGASKWPAALRAAVTGLMLGACASGQAEAEAPEPVEPVQEIEEAGPTRGEEYEVALMKKCMNDKYRAHRQTHDELSWHSEYYVAKTECKVEVFDSIKAKCDVSPKGMGDLCD